MSKKVNPRYLAALILIAIIAPLIFLVSEVGITGRIIGIIFITLVSSYATYEAIKKLDISIYSKIFISTFVLIILFVDWNFLDNLVYRKDPKWLLSNMTNWAYIFIPIILLIGLYLIDSKITMRLFFYLVFIAIIIPIFSKILITLNVVSWKLIVFIIGLTIISDSMAYFGGALFGKTKLAPKISPNKTWEGAIIGYIFCAIFVGIFGFYLDIFAGIKYFMPAYIISILFLPLIAPIGDLLFSSIKRDFNIKDFSNLIPGHGGIIDRIDALMLVTLSFAFIWGVFS